MRSKIINPEMNKLNTSIEAFALAQRCATICTTDENNNPYCFSCFYAFDPTDGLLHYKTSADSHHVALMNQHTAIAGTILPDTLHLVTVQGLQFVGHVLPTDHPLTKNAYKRYHKRFPFALAMPGTVWTLQLTEIKMTDNTKGFGTKIKWELEAVM